MQTVGSGCLCKSYDAAWARGARHRFIFVLMLALAGTLSLSACDGSTQANGKAGAGDGTITHPRQGTGDDQPPGSSTDNQPPVSQTDDQTAFKTTVYVEVIDYCAGCHDGRSSSVPAFAHPDVAVAYDVITKKGLVDLQNPAKSRIALKLIQEKHNCWSGSGQCASDAMVMQKAVETWLALVGKSPAANGIDAQTLRSSATTFAASANTGALQKRVSTAVIALYTFREGNGTTVHDLSGVAPALDLTMTGMEWLGGQGLKNVSGKAEATVEASSKLFDMIAGANGSGNYTIEAWLVADNTTQSGPARAVTYSIDVANRNFMLGQTAAEWAFRNRSLATGIGANGTPNLTTTGSALKTELQHVVMTFDQVNGRKIFLNGVDSGVTDVQGPGVLGNWDSGYSFVIGNEKTSTRLWKGDLYLVAVYNKALNAAEVRQNFDAGFKDRVVLTFDISNVSGIAGSSIQIEAGEIDKAGYLFANPTYIGAKPGGLRIKGLQIAINDSLPAVGQAFRNIDVNVDATEQLLVNIGTVMAKDQGRDADTFMLVFEAVGDKTNTVPEPDAAPLAMVMDQRAVIPISGIRTFDQINDTMSALTGVASATTAVASVFNQIKQSLPGASNIMSFLPAQQIGITKLATEYCNALTDSSALRAAFFGTAPAVFEFGSAVSAAFGTQEKQDRISNALIDKMIGINLSSQPSQAEANGAINALINDLIAANPAGDATRTRAIVKGACTAVLSSAALMVQ